MNEHLRSAFPLISTLYGSMSLFLTITHNVFLLYYVDMFVSVYKIDKASFWIGEILFLIWNSVNDPLFGWLSDHKLLTKGPAPSRQQNFPYHSMTIVIGRLRILSKYGPLFAISFALFWVHWLPTAIQFAICLCLYDGFLTAVDLQHTALLADLAVVAKDRAKLNKHCSVFSAFGSISVFVSYMFWNKQNVFSFQVFCVVIALLSMVGFFCVTQALIRVCNDIEKHEKQHEPATTAQYPEYHSDIVTASSFAKMDLTTYAKQLTSNHNFRWFISMNLLQVFHCHFNSNFFPLFLDALVGHAVSPGVGPLLIGLSFILPHVNNIYFLGLCEKHGVYKVINWLFYTKLLLALIMLTIGNGNVWLLCIFIASNRIFTEGTCKLLNLVVSDLVDEDFVRHNREHAASAVLFGMSSLLSKPGQTLAPLIGTWLLTVYTGEDIFQSGLNQDASDRAFHDLVQWPNHNLPPGWMSRRDACFILLVTIPIVCSILQLIAWSRFTLHGTRLNQVKSLRLHRTNDLV
ncbi:transmembrane protein 180-like [Clavelina lepadiformis]|uniref:transmembrane protein 180-like n=1 Tax=Clavelina lepadiformis TaxID=159417 RepID=UPI004041FFAC